VLSASRPELIEVFSGLSPRTFRRLVAQVERRGGRLVADGIKGRQWSLPLADRVLLVATYYRTDLTMRQLPPLFGIRTAAVHRIIDRLGPFLALAPARRRYGPDTVLIVDGTLVPTPDHSVAASSLPRSGDLPAQHPQLVPQDRDLDVLRIRRRTDPQQPEQPTQQHESDTADHAEIMHLCIRAGQRRNPLLAPITLRQALYRKISRQDRRLRLNATVPTGDPRRFATARALVKHDRS
jgi:hypothetical protein